jgi:FkbM family methyltransferase
MFKNILVFLYKKKFFRRIIPSFLRRFYFLFNNEIFNIENFKLRLNLRNSLERKIFLENSFENEQINFIKKNIENVNFDYFIDIGAYIGYYTLYFSQFSNIQKIVSIEANKTNYDNLLKNISLNKLNNVIAHNFACSDTDSQVKLWYSDPNKMGGSSVLNTNDYEFNKYNSNPNLDQNHLKKHYNKSYKDYKKSKENFFYQNIESKKFDNIFNAVNKNLLIKIDVERHEIFVLKGAEKILNNNKIFLQIEIFPELFNDINNFLTSRNFKLINNIGWDYYFKNY